MTNDRGVVPAGPVTGSPPEMQAFVEAAVLRMVASQSSISASTVLRTLPRADERDVDRAVEVLLDEGCLVVGTQGPRHPEVRYPAELTAKGRARLQE